MHDFGAMKEILGMKITRDPGSNTIYLSQSAYILKVLADEDFVSHKPSRVPHMPKEYLKKATEGERAGVDTTRFKRILGCLLYIAICTRPDISAATSAVAAFCSEPGSTHVIALERILRYLKMTHSLRLTFKGSEACKLSGYVDADYANERSGRRSRGGYVIYLGLCPIAWRSTKQKIVALSSTEAETVAAVEACRCLVWTIGVMRIGFHEHRRHRGTRRGQSIHNITG